RGKVALLNDVIALERAEIVALSDCSSMLSLDALKLTAEHFRYADVGVVGGAYHFDGCGDVSEEVYWSYQRAIKVGEARFGAPMGMHGAFYAFRRDLAEPLGLDTINDDFILPMKIVEKGFRAIYDEEIKCIETEPTSENMNWRRRIRISAGNVQQAINCCGLLSIKHPGISFCFFSGKFLRAWMPFILFLIPCLSFWASLESLFFGWFLIAQILGLIIVSLPVMSSGRIGKIHKTLQYLLVGHAAGFVGMTRYLTGLEKGAWKRAA
ncbi:MAG: glycosyltransferase family 2 protein, partial [Alphaproteobacteria bacterium]|nr:glycosyltransferase family 2 protein [Alphaproteobacteria bacterium]